MQAGKYEDAGKYLQKATKENGDRAEYYIAYGMYLNEQGEYDEALKQFKNAYQDTKNTIANVNNKQVYLGQAIAYSHLQEYEKALDACDKALELKNTESLNHRIWCSKGVVLEALGRQDEAVKAYQKAVDENKTMMRNMKIKKTGRHIIGLAQFIRSLEIMMRQARRRSF